MHLKLGNPCSGILFHLQGVEETAVKQRPIFAFVQYFVTSLVVLLLFLGGCRLDADLSPVKIGLAINLSGRGGLAGEDIRDGALLAVDRINRNGGINGRMLELLIRDDGNTPLGIQTADEDLIANGVKALIGHSTSGNTLIAYPLVTSRDIILITPYAATNKLTGKDDLFFRTQVNCDLYGKKTAELFQRQGIHSVAMLLDMSNRDFVMDWRQSLQKYFSGTIHPVTFHSDRPVPWFTLIDRLLESDPDGILLLTEASMTGVALQKLTAAGFSGRRYATVWADTPQLLHCAASSAEGLSLITFIDPDNNRPSYQEFSRAMQTQFQKKASARSSRAYEVVTILADALRRAPDLTARSLKKALLSGTYETILGTVRFDRYGDVERPVYEIVVSRNEFHSTGPI